MFDPNESLKSLDYCSKYFSFNNSILFTSEKVSNKNHEIINIEKFKDITDYSDFILKIGKFIKSDHVLIIQDDGHIVNPSKWDSSFLNYDYVGAPGHLVTSGEKDGNKRIIKMRIKMQKKIELVMVDSA